MTEIFLVFVGLGVIASFGFAIVMNRLRRTRATYELYAVKDRFILLVAKGVISEDSILFKHYYKRTNMLLQYAPNIGLDQAYKSFLFLNTKNKYTKTTFAEQLEKAKEETEKVLQSKELEIDSVSEAVEMYYSANMEMILAHSSITRFFYYALKHKLLNSKTLKSAAPQRVQRAVKLLEFSGDEIDQIYERRNCAA